MLNDPFEEAAGPFYYNQEQSKSGFLCAKKNCNGMLMCHGGCIAALADANVFTVGKHELPGPSVTISLTVNYTSGAQIGEWVEATGDVTSSTKNMLFVSGRVYVGERTVATYSAVVKKLQSRL